MNKQSTKGLQGSEITLHGVAIMETCHYTPVQTDGMSNTKSEHECKWWTVGPLIVTNIPR